MVCLLLTTAAAGTSCGQCSRGTLRHQQILDGAQKFPMGIKQWEKAPEIRRIGERTVVGVVDNRGEIGQGRRLAAGVAAFRFPTLLLTHKIKTTSKKKTINKQ